MFHLLRLMSSSFLIKMFELHIQAFHSYKSILSILPCLSLSDPEVTNEEEYWLMMPL